MPLASKPVGMGPTALGVHIFAGGFTVGVMDAGFKVLAHLEDSAYGVSTAVHNFPGLDVRIGRENWQETEFVNKVDLLYANPPCFSPETQVLTESGWRRIDEVVRLKSTEPVACVDGGRLTFRPVGGWHKNPYDGWLYDIRLVHGTKRRYFTLATVNHRFLTRRGWVPAGQLNRHDLVCTGRLSPNRAQQALIDGMLLGDGKLNRQPQLSTSQTCEELVRLKYMALTGLTSGTGVTVLPKVCSDGLDRRDQTSFYSSTCIWTRQERARWYPDGIKRVPADLALTDLTLAVWYMDDGRGRNLTTTKEMNYAPGGRQQGAYADFAICGFDEEDAALLVTKLAEVGLAAEVRRRKTGYLDLRIVRESAADFFLRVGRFIPSSMRYKLPLNAPPFDPVAWELGRPDIGWDRVTRKPARKLTKSAVYCIDVPGPQNFVTRNGVVHNCAIFSTAGISTSRGKDAWREDPRLGCWHRAWEVFESTQPKVFALESVCQAYTKGKELIDGWTRAALNLGYSVTHLLEDAVWCGLPQKRKRFFFIAYRPWLPLQFRFDFTDPPTIGEVLAKVHEPGHVAEHCKGERGIKYRQCIIQTRPGGKLSTTYDDLGYGGKFGPKGNVIGRPGFMYCRLNNETTMGAFTGDFFIHPDEDRFIGVEEMKALCGYPSWFTLLGLPSGHASMLARAVLPPVGAWLARSVRKVLRQPERPWVPQTVTLVDLRKPTGVYRDLTADYSPETNVGPIAALSCLVQSCDACPRMRGQTRVLSPASGTGNSGVLFIGEAPGRDEVGLTGIPFYGDASGVNFEMLLRYAGLKREDVFIMNSVLCNPPGEGTAKNGTPTQEEVFNCSRHFREAIKTLNPSVIVTLGASALRAAEILEPHGLEFGRAVGKPVDWYGRLLFPLYHPGPRALQVRNFLAQQADYQQLRKVLAGLPVREIAVQYPVVAWPAVKPVVQPLVRVIPKKIQALKVMVSPMPISRLSDNGDSPLEGEGSGKFIRRLWMTGRYTPEQLVELVHKHWEGRTTKVGDVYYNYRRLIDSGEPNVPAWPARKAEKPVKSSGMAVSKSPVKQTFVGIPGARTVLLTGSTPIQVGSERTKLKIITAAASWYRALCDLGYSVDWRPVTPGEDVSRYDTVFVILNKPNSIASAHVHGAFWTLMKRPGAIVLVDDWQTRDLVKAIQSYAKVKERLFRLRGGDLPNEISNSIFEFVNFMDKERWPWPVIAPVLGTGDLDLLELNAGVIGIDPTAYADRYRHYGAIPVKEKKWVQASLLHKDYVNYQWPVEGYGWLDRGDGGKVGHSNKAGANAQPRVPEPELAKVYLGAWGVLSPAHPHAGSSWWRVRYLMAADSHCILSADPTEAKCLGQPYIDGSNRRAVEGMTDQQLKALVLAQRDCLLDITWSKDRVKEALTSVIDQVKSKV